jgi:hypothetical protein
MTAFESAIQLRSRVKCCINARAFAKFATNCRGLGSGVPNSGGDRAELVDLVPVKGRQQL